MKKETKRYTLVEYIGQFERSFDNMEMYEKYLKGLYRSNRRKSEKFIGGNVVCTKSEDGKIKITIHAYNKLTEPSTISEILSITTNTSEEELIKKYKDEGKLRTKEHFSPDINVAYFETKNTGEKEIVHYDTRIKYLPTIYKEDARFLDFKFINSCLKSHARRRDFVFFNSLCNEFMYDRCASQEIERLRYSIERAQENGSYMDEILIECKNLYEALVYEKNKGGRLIIDENGHYVVSKRRQLNFGLFVRDYNMTNGKRKSPLRYNGTYDSRYEQIIKEKENLKKEKESIEQEKKNFKPVEEGYQLRMEFIEDKKF